MLQRRHVRKFALFVVSLAFVVIACALWIGFRQHKLESRINNAFLNATPDGTLTRAGTNTIIVIGESAVPVILQWSSGKEPAWYSIYERVFRKLGRKAPMANRWERKEKARKVAYILQSKAKAAVPTLLVRLNDPDPEVRRFSVHVLGAIGPSMGTNAFRQMTNCLKDAENNVRNDVLWALQFHNVHAYPAETLIPVFMAGLNDSFRVARQNAETGMKRLMEKDAHAKAAVEKAVLDSGLIMRSIVRPWEHEKNITGDR